MSDVEGVHASTKLTTSDAVIAQYGVMPCDVFRCWCAQENNAEFELKDPCISIKHVRHHILDLDIKTLLEQQCGFIFYPSKRLPSNLQHCPPRAHPKTWTHDMTQVVVQMQTTMMSLQPMQWHQRLGCACVPVGSAVWASNQQSKTFWTTNLSGLIPWFRVGCQTPCMFSEVCGSTHWLGSWQVRITVSQVNKMWCDVAEVSWGSKLVLSKTQVMCIYCDAFHRSDKDKETVCVQESQGRTSLESVVKKHLSEDDISQPPCFIFSRQNVTNNQNRSWEKNTYPPLTQTSERQSTKWFHH